MAEMELFIKPIFAKESVDRFATDVERSLGGGGSGGLGGGGGQAKKEQEKQTGLLEQISRFTKISATAGIVATAATAVPGAFNAGKDLAQGDRNDRLERAFRGGDNYNQDVADAISAGEDLNEVLTQEMVIQEGLDQARRKAKAELEGNTIAAEDAATTLQDLKAVYAEVGGSVDEFGDKIQELAAKGVGEGIIDPEEFAAIDEAIDGTKQGFEELYATAKNTMSDVDVLMQETSDNVDNKVGSALYDVETLLKTLPDSLETLPLVEKFQGVVDILQEINDLLTDIKNFDFDTIIDAIGKLNPAAGLGFRLGGNLIDSKRAGDTIR